MDWRSAAWPQLAAAGWGGLVIVAFAAWPDGIGVVVLAAVALLPARSCLRKLHHL
ncbi:MAG: hypothetical protein LBU05_01740 [Bifidobacteriaceae bacterium]|nr:hypothetical protein [Bifidobacteriaceae bacterium]